jgi:ADP-L-glycero-D-manno-heptose 6-epimerase
VEFIDFPDHLKGRYQNYTQADLTRLAQAGYTASFLTVEAGISKYIKFLDNAQI